ncbi:hypothetical protein QOZ80_6AG0514250 [Eleusine coracana subsp. coracana]|nr:hypothetical protein QOZ80_6AG0514250 [Eleusine coracana subsp. coracana]
MAAALQCCRFVPSPALSAASSSRRRPLNMLSMIVPTPGRRDHLCFPGLKLQEGSTAAALRPRVVVRAAQNGGQHAQQPPRTSAGQHFVEEREYVMRRYNNIINIDHGCLYMEATAMSAQVCLSANKSLKMASRVMDAAYLNLDAAAPNEISTSTVYGTLLDYVDIFLDAADASYNRTVNKKTVTSFLGALRGLASISHILLEAALEALTHTHPRESLSEYAFNCDVKNMRHEFNERMNDLEDGIVKASAVEIGKLAVPAIHEGAKITESFVSLMVSRRRRALGKANTEVVV